MPRETPDVTLENLLWPLPIHTAMGLLSLWPKTKPELQLDASCLSRKNFLTSLDPCLLLRVP